MDRDKPSHLSDCANDRWRKIKNLSKKELEKKYELLCGCEKVSLENLLSTYQCKPCQEDYSYSFCLNEVVYEVSSWHCQDCRTCRDSSEWHCEKCNRCTYGLTLACDNCGNESPYLS